MRSPFVRRLLIGFALPALGLAQSAPMPSGADFHDGGTWVWRRVDDYTGLELHRYRRTVALDGERPVLTVDGKPFTVRQIFTHARKPTDASNAWRVWPLTVGSRWEETVDWTNEFGNPARTHSTYEVVAYESITIPAGTFMAFRIESRGLWQTHEYRNVNGTGGVRDTYWYAPAADADVKFVRDSPPYTRFTQELVEYRRAAPSSSSPSSAAATATTPASTSR